MYNYGPKPFKRAQKAVIWGSGGVKVVMYLDPRVVS